MAVRPNRSLMVVQGSNKTKKAIFDKTNQVNISQFVDV